MTPKARVLSNVRYVDNGQVITTAGVSAGTDGALHVVAKMKGLEAAKATAFYMEYDRWQPKSGKINETAFMQDIRNLGLEAALRNNQPKPDDNLPLYYPGELTELATELLDAKPAESEAIFRFLLKQTRPSSALYDGLGMALGKRGKTVPPDSRSFRQKLASGDIEWAKQIYQKLVNAEPGWMLFTEDELNQAAYNLLNSKKKKEALEVFLWVTELFPASPNAWDSLAEYYESVGEKALAVSASEQCLANISASEYDDCRKELYQKISRERMERLTLKN